MLKAKQAKISIYFYLLLVQTVLKFHTQTTQNYRKQYFLENKPKKLRKTADIAFVFQEILLPDQLFT